MLSFLSVGHYAGSTADNFKHSDFLRVKKFRMKDWEILVSMIVSISLNKI